MRMKEDNGGSHDASSNGRSLRNYLYDKYVYRNDDLRRLEAAPHPSAPHSIESELRSSQSPRRESTFAIMGK